MAGFTPAQKQLYDTVTAEATTLDGQLIALVTSARTAGADPEDVRVVRRWLSDQVVRETAR
jgi:uncharacterized protein (DUF2342 family)